MAKNKQKKTSIGGQALIEGVMMRGPSKTAISVRKQSGEIVSEIENNKPKKWYNKVPLLRGGAAMLGSMILGYKYLMKSADMSGMTEEEEPGRFEQWLERKLPGGAMKIIMPIAAMFGMVLAIAMFIVLPSFLVDLLELSTDVGGWRAAIEAVLKIGVFVLYLFLVSKMKEIRRVFAYHGAEHKSVACYEAGDELTPENAKKHTRFHPRCGTSNLLIIIVISIAVYMLVSVESLVLRSVIRIALLPIIVGISYEILMIAGKHDNVITRIVSAPGKWLQRLTTFEPDDEMLEVAITALVAVMPTEGESDTWGSEKGNTDTAIEKTHQSSEHSELQFSHSVTNDVSDVKNAEAADNGDDSVERERIV